MSVLLVDDEPAVTRALELNLRKWEGWTILTADSGAAALALLDQKDDIEVLASDFNMPEMDGAQLINQALAMKPGLYTIVFTGWEEREYAIRALRVGADDFIDKQQEFSSKMAQAIRRGIRQVAIQRMGRILLSLDSERELFDLAFRTIKECGGFGAVCVAELESESGTCRIQRAIDLGTGGEVDQRAVLSDDSAYSYAIRTGNMVFPSMSEVRNLRPYFTKSESMLVVPLHGRKALGIEDRAPDKFNVETLRFVQDVAERLSLAIDKIYHLERWVYLQRKGAEYEQGLLARALLHEINNPLNNIAMMAQGGGTLEARDLEDLIANVGRIKRVLEAFLDNRVKSEGELQPIYLGKVLEEAISRFRVYNPRSGVEIEEVERELLLPSIAGNREMLVTAFVNLLQNAAVATGHHGRISIQAHFVPLRQQIELAFSDDGHGIAPERLRRIFDYGYTTGSEGRSGQGLALTQEVIQRSGGEITVTSREGYGTTFRVVFPVRAADEKAAMYLGPEEA